MNKSEDTNIADALDKEFGAEIDNNIVIRLNPRLEAFAQNLAKGLSATQAWSQTYPKNRKEKILRKTIREEACRKLKENPDVKRRVIQIQREACKKTILSLRGSLEILSNLARDKNVHTAVRRASANDIKDFHLKKYGEEVAVNLKADKNLNLTVNLVKSND
ncbi:MAG: hypothetical protein LBQ47_05845 [Endomicrobium sp.]|jgi:protoporphyrinogen oxidase|nr:hypothetical protein [Endomicrobium sp.]